MEKDIQKYNIKNCDKNVSRSTSNGIDLSKIKNAHFIGIGGIGILTILYK